MEKDDLKTIIAKPEHHQPKVYQQQKTLELTPTTSNLKKLGKKQLNHEKYFST